ncbi:tetratricopeptide repeat protein, partial [Capnocytophaga leadbetteri]|uniref:tetratricopeptide repeat protein n=1 Tax=Capnocytophaga leadbetteri TaxID=327575 RepID=UPI0028E64783
MRRFLFITLLLSTIVTYQGFAQSSMWGDLAMLAPAKRTTPYKAKPLPSTAPATEKARIAKMEKELQDADTAFEKEEYEKTYIIYTKYENNLDGEQYYRLGWMYATANATDKNFEKARIYFEKGANLNNADAMNGLGSIYRIGGNGVTQNYEKALFWYKKAIDNGSAKAMNNLGWMYNEGLGVTQDYKQAFYWYKKAAEAGNSNGMNNLANRYYNG